MSTLKVLLQYGLHVSDEDLDITHNCRGTHVSFWWRDAELDQANLSFLDPSDPSGQVRSLLVQHQTFHQLSVFNCTAKVRELGHFVITIERSSYLRFITHNIM